MATTSSIGYYLTPNTTGKTTGYFAHVIPNGTAYFSEIVSDVMASISTSEQRIMMVWNETIKVALKYAAQGYTVDLGGIRIRPRIPGSMEYEDQDFEQGVDSFIVDAYGDDEFSSIFDNVIPYKVSAADIAGTIAVSNIMDVTTEVFATVIGTTQFAVLGNGITLDGEDEYVKAFNKKTGALIATATVDRVERGQRAYCHFPTSLPDGETTLEIGTHGLAGATALRKFTKNVTAVYVQSTPTLTSIQQGDRAAGNVGFGNGAEYATTLAGTIPGGFKETDGLKVDGAPTTAEGTDYTASMSLKTYVTASTDTTITLGNGFVNDSSKPDVDWNGKNAQIVLVRDGVEYPLVFAFSAE